MRCAIVENGIVVNVILADDPDEFGSVACSDEVSPGWTYADGEFTPPEVEPLPPEPLGSLTARQLRLGLVTNGLSLDQVTATIDGIPDEQDRAVAKIEWEYASQFERDHPLIAQVGAALGLTEFQIDTMWKQAMML